MRAIEFITEVFQPGKTNWKWRHRGSEEATADFTVGDRTYQWHAYSHVRAGNPTKWEMQFRLIRNQNDPDDIDMFGTTGTGNSAEVLSTAVDITRAFLKDYGLDKVEEITFSAKENSRIALYAKMIKRLLPDWDLYQKYTEHNGMEYHLTDRRAYDKPENKINEVGNSFYDVEKGNSYSPSLNLRAKAVKGVVNPMPKSDSFNFKTDNGTDYQIRLYPSKLKDGGESVTVTFGNRGASYDDTYGITGAGDSVKVFSTVKAVLAKYLSEHPKINSIVFSAKENEPSRVKLYTTFVKQFKRWFPDFTNVDISPINGMVRFLLKKDQLDEEIIDEMPLPADWDPQQMRQQTTSFKSRLAYALERAKKLGTGSSRVATIIEYEGRPTVLKIAKNAKGLAQNSVEADILSDGYASQLGILIPIIDYDEQNREPSWVHTELATKANEKQLCMLMKCDSLGSLVRYANAIAGKYRNVTAQSYQDEMLNNGKSEQDIEILTDYANILADLANSFDVELADFGRAANWGIYNGKPVIIDVGFNSNVMQQYYR